MDSNGFRSYCQGAAEREVGRADLVLQRGEAHGGVRRELAARRIDDRPSLIGQCRGRGQVTGE